MLPLRRSYSSERRGVRLGDYHGHERVHIQEGNMVEAAVKLCECGCGKLAPIAKQTDTRRGHVKGQPIRFVLGHQYAMYPEFYTRKRNRSSASERFWNKVCKQGPILFSELGPCWMWTGTRNASGHGRLMWQIGTWSMTYTHRIAWFLETGKWPEPCALHKCDNPSCVRFSHLYEGTKAQNSKDMVERGRSARGERQPIHKLTDDKVEAVL